MEKINSFNIRAYALCVEDGKLLSLFEEYAGEKLIKLPGGGLEFGEGIVACLHREFFEELNLKIENLEHFYTQEDFLASKFRENEQLLTVYYSAKILNLADLEIKEKSIDRVEWIDLSDQCPFNLPIDQLVFEKARSHFLE